MTYRQLFKSFQNQLTGKYDSGEVESMFFLAIENIFQLKKLDFIMKESDEIEAEQLKHFENLISRLIGFEPIQYILEEAWFNEHKYFVNEDVLIPRSETEELIELIKQKKPNAGELIDIGTGSGCIAIELALHYKTGVYAIDISEKALAVARKNADRLGVKVEFLHTSILYDKFLFNRKFDVIVSNPPYVMESEKKLMSDNVVKYEPAGALYVPDNDPLIFYKAIRDFALQYADKEALIALEINEQLGDQTTALFENSFYNVVIHKDIHEKDRFVTAIFNGK